MGAEPGSSIRDAYGFEVKGSKLQSLYEKYEPVLQGEERERAERWNGFLCSIEAASDLPPVPPSGGGSRSLTVLADLLGDCLRRGDGDASPRESRDRKQLQTLVQVGVPTEIRGKLWKMFLNVDAKRKEGVYETLVSAGMQQANNCKRAHSLSAGSAGAGLSGTSDSSSQAPHNPDQELNNSAFAPAAAAVARPPSHLPPLGSHSSFSSRDSSDRAAEPGTGLSAAASLAAAGSMCSLADSECSAESRSQPCTPSEAGPGISGKGSSMDWANQIDKDLHRTFPGHLAMDEKGRAALKNILVAYSQYNPFVGYCQGMNFIAGVLLLFMDEEDVFWCLSAIVEDQLPGYFSVAMVAPQVDQLVFNHLVCQHFPKLAALFQSQGLDVTSVSMQWFLCIFVNSLPLESTLRVWDMLFFDRSPVVLFRCALALLELYAEALQATEDAMECLELLAQIARWTFDGCRLIDVACIGFSTVLPEDIDQLRDLYRDKITNRLKDLPIDTQALLAVQSDFPSVLHTGPPETIAARQLFGCDSFPPGWLDGVRVAAGDGPSAVPAAAAAAGSRGSGAATPGDDDSGEDDGDRAERSSALEASGSGRKASMSMSVTRREILGKMQGRLGAPRPSPLATGTSYWAGAAAVDSPGGRCSPTHGAGGGANRLNSAQAMLSSALDRVASVADPARQDGLAFREQQDGLGSSDSVVQTMRKQSLLPAASASGSEGRKWRRLHNRTPSKAQVAAYEIAINPAIRELAIAQSFIRAERQPGAESRNTSPPPTAGTGTGELLASPDRVGALEPAGPRYQLSPTGNAARRGTRTDNTFFVSTTALSRTTSREASASGANPQLGRSSVEAAGNGGEMPTVALDQANAILHTVLDGLRQEVATAQARRQAAEERSSTLQQTSSLLTVKLNKLLTELEEKKQTVEELGTKVVQTRGDLHDLEEELRSKDSQLEAILMEKEIKEAEIKSKDDMIANLQRKVKRFQRKSTVNLPGTK